MNAGPGVGYGRAIRCLRLATALAGEAAITFYPVSEACREFLRAANTHGNIEIRESNSTIRELPPLVVTDLRELHGITAAIHRNGARHISLHDLGLAQCQSDVVIDGSITRLFPYSPDKHRTFFIGPQYMITRALVRQARPADSVLIALGGGPTDSFIQQISDHVRKAGLTPLVTRGFIGSSPMTDDEFAQAMETCRYAISSSGLTLYDLLASGVPTVAVAFDRIQLRTADSFHQRGAVLSAGLMDSLPTDTLLNCCTEMIQDVSLTQRVSEVGKTLVDGKGLSRVVDIVRRQLWQTHQVKTFTIY